MTAKQQWMVVLVVVALLAGGAFAAGRALSSRGTPFGVGAEAPGFSAHTIDASPRVKTLSAYRGDVVVLNLWATYCVPCRVEMPSLEALHRDFASKGLKVVGVSIDDEGFAPQIRDFVREYALSFEILQEGTGAIETIYRTNGVPKTIVIGRDGVIRKMALGAEDWNSADNRRLIEQLLAEPKS